MAASDKELLEGLLLKFGLRERDLSLPLEANNFSQDENDITVGSGDGFPDSYVVFKFKDDGSFHSHGVWNEGNQV